MPLNKEMIFGLLAFGGDDMKMVVPNKKESILVRGNNTPITFNTPVLITSISNTDTHTDNIEYNITYPDDSTITLNRRDVNLTGLYYPEGTKFEFSRKSSDNLMRYIECKWIDV
jgi:hypothetical protein